MRQLREDFRRTPDYRSGPMPPNATATREQLIAAAETLFAERGIEGVSLREINAAAGQRNASSIQYHFGNRDGLLAAVIDG